MKKKERDTNSDATAFAASTYGAEATVNYAEASKIAFDGMEVLETISNRLSNVGSGQSQGNLFEYIVSTKFNMDAAIKSSDIRAFVTASEGRPHAPADIEIRLDDRLLEEVQAKSYRNAAESLFAQSHDKYAGMQRVSPSDQYDHMVHLGEKRIATGTLKSNDYQDTLDNLNPSLKYKEIQASDTTRAEAVHAAENPSEYTNSFKLNATTNEAIHAMGNAAMAGGAISGAISFTKHAIAYKTGDVTLEEASLYILRDMGSGAARSSAVAGTSVLIKNIALDNGLGALAKGNMATAIAVTAINTSKSIIKYAQGEIDFAEMTVEIGQSGASSGAGLYFGMAGAAIGGPIGAMVGSMTGYMIANISYQAVAEIFKSAALSEEQYKRLAPIYDNAIRELERTRHEFEYYMETYFKETNRVIQSSFEQIDNALKDSDMESLSIGLIKVAEVFGRKLEMTNFDEFEAFMQNENTKLIL